MVYRIEDLLKKGKLWNIIVIDELGKRIAGEIKAREIILLCALGKSVKNVEYSSFNLLAHSESSAGKDYITKQVLKLFPDDDVFMRTRITPAVLNYWKPYKKSDGKSWNGKVLYLPDISEAVMNCEALKLMCSEGSFITITEKGHAKDIEIKGKPVIITTTTTATPTAEILNRFAIVKLDESQEHTKEIHKMQGEIARKGSLEDYSVEIKELFAGLTPIEVRIPFAHKIASVFPTKLTRERRNFNRFLDWIKAVASLHRQERTHHHDESISAELQDYDIAKEPFMNVFSGLPELPLDKTNKKIIEILEKTKEFLSAREIAQKMESYLTLQNLYPRLKSLQTIKILEIFYDKDIFNNLIIKYALSEEFKEKEPIKLPNSEEL